MKTRRRLNVASGALIAALLLASGGCSKKAAPEAKPEASKPVAKSETPAPTAPKARVQAAPKPAPNPKAAPEPELPPESVPDILFSLRGLNAGQLAGDRPLFVAVRVEPSIESAKTLTLAPAAGRWSDGLKVELTASGVSEKVLLQAQRVDGVGEPAAATLGTGQTAEGTWLFPSTEIAKLPPGSYQVRVTLTVADGGGWCGKVAGEPAAFSLVVAMAGDTPGQQVQRAIALAGEAMLVKDWTKAAQLLDGRLTADPDNIELLKSRALLCLQGDNIIAANACVGRAWARVAREQWEHPPADLYVLSQAVMAAMSKPPEASAKTPLAKWSFPPEAVMAPLPELNRPAGK